MPRVAPIPRPGVLQRFVLETRGRQSHGAAVGEQALAIGRDEMGHRAALPDMAMEPETAVHRVDHPLATVVELAIQGFRTGRVAPRHTGAPGGTATDRP